MSNVYSVGNNRQLIIYNAGSNIFLRVAHFGGLDRPIVLAADYLCGLTECIYNSSLYYSYINQNGSLILKNIMDTANVLAIDCNYVQEYSNPKLAICNDTLLLFYLKQNPVSDKPSLHCITPDDNNAMGKTYCYTCYVGYKKPVFNRKYVHITGAVPDVEAMKKAASYLVGVHDFASFCGNPKMKKSTVREIYSIDISLKGSYLNMTFHGSGFLQYMVRILSGTLLEVGFGKREADSMQELLEAKNRSLAGATAPAKGLSLLKVHYAN